MRKDFRKELPELVEAGLISEETAGNIEAYYRQKEPDNINRLYLAFAILGSVLVGAGVILIVAHNWDDFSRPVKTIFAFLPMLLAQIACGYVLVKKFTNTAWREGSAAVLFFTVASTISLVSQIYHIEGDLGSFLLTWSWLVLPIMYVMRSGIASLMFWAVITYYACEVGYWDYPNQMPDFYFLFLLASLPFYFYLLWKKVHSNFTIIHNLIIPLSLVIVLGTLGHHEEEFLFISYMSLFGLLYIIGTSYFSQQKDIHFNGYTIIGALGTLSLLVFFSFRWIWEEIAENRWESGWSGEFISAIVLTALASLAFVFFRSFGNRKGARAIDPLPFAFLAFVPIFLVSSAGHVILATVLINLMLLAIGIFYLWRGAQQNSLPILNFGLLIITVLIISRFFDVNMSFVIRGILFMMVGGGFFFANYWLLKKRKAMEAVK